MRKNIFSKIRLDNYSFGMIFLGIFIGISFIMFSCKTIGGDSDLEVAGGKIIDYSEYPGVVRLFSSVATDSKEVSSCTGSIVSSNVVLTAAHCTNFTKNHYFRIYTADKHYINSQQVTINPSYIQEESILSSEWKKLNAKNDVAVWIFPDGTFKNYEEKLQISDVDLNEVTGVRYVGWGCFNELKERTENNNGTIYDYYVLECDRTRSSEKRTGTNSIDIVADDKSCIEIYSSTGIDKRSGLEQLPTGKDVLTSLGDSGGPLLLRDNDKKIVGISSRVRNKVLKDSERCNLLYRDDKQKKDCQYFSSIFTNPISSYNKKFLEDAVDNYGAIIPGIQVGVRVIEYNGKVKVLYKEESTSFNQNVEEHRVIKEFNKGKYGTVEALKKAWRDTNFYQRSKVSWSFE